MTGARRGPGPQAQPGGANAAATPAERVRAGLTEAAAGKFVSQTRVPLPSAPLSALLTHRTAFCDDALLPLVNVAVTDGNVALQDVSRAVWSTPLLFGFRDCFLVTALAGLALIALGLFAGD